jgi:hypothetical protein
VLKIIWPVVFDEIINFFLYVRLIQTLFCRVRKAVKIHGSFKQNNAIAHSVQFSKIVLE